MVPTRNVTLSKEERTLLIRLANREWQDADEERMGTIPGTDRERRAEEYQIMVLNLLAKLKGAVDEL